METLMIIVSGVFVTVATYLLLSNNIIQVILGSAVLTHAVHLLLMTMGGLGGDSVPIITEGANHYVDALPQALILTSIVINFGVTAFFLVVGYQAYKATNFNSLEQMRGYNYD